MQPCNVTVGMLPPQAGCDMPQLQKRQDKRSCEVLVKQVLAQTSQWAWKLCLTIHWQAAGTMLTWTMPLLPQAVYAA